MWAMGIGVLAAVLGSELVLRVALPADEILPGELWWFREGGSGVAGQYTVDEEMGFRPRLGTPTYGEHGAFTNEYDLGHSAERRRILFIGDSVTARGRIVTELRQQWDGPEIEWWNAGVESFNTRQEVDYYRRYNAGIDPDHVILTFHPNDFGHTPVAFTNEDGHLVVHTPGGEEEVNGFLMRYSRLYRLWFTSRVPPLWSVDESARNEVRGALAELIELSGPDRRLSVILFPILEPSPEWDQSWLTAYEAAMEIFEELGIRYYDLKPVLEDALRDGIDVQETPGDSWHPSAEFAGRAAQALLRDGLLR